MIEDWPSVRVAAQEYFARGFRIVPLYGVDGDGLCRCGSPDCKPRDAGKHEPPDTDGMWKNGRIFVPQDFTEEHNIALAMGPWNPPSEGGEWLVALDVDGHDDVNAFFYPALPQTLTQLTPTGAHFIFRVPPRTPLGNWVNLFGGDRDAIKLDLRYARGRVVVNPSRGSATRGTGKYQWKHWMRPERLPQHALDAIYEIRRAAGRDMPAEWDRGDKEP